MQEADSATTTAPAGPATSSSALPVVLQPTNSFTISNLNLQHPNLQLTPAADGKGVFLIGSEPAVNLWKSLVWLSPEILTIGGCLMTLLILRRVAQRPQVRGEWHCRRCNYLLKQAAGTRCPECGGEITAAKVMKGAARKPRIALLVCLLLTFAILYFSNSLSLLRHCAASEWIDWRSTWVAEQSKARSWRFTSAGFELVWSIDHIDLGTGIVTRTPLSVRDSIKGMAVAADGRSVAAWGDRGLHVYSWPDGEPLASTRLTSELGATHWSDRIRDACFAADLSSAFVITTFGTLDRWSLSSGTAHTVTRLNADDTWFQFLPALSSSQKTALFDYNTNRVTLLDVSGAREVIDLESTSGRVDDLEFLYVPRPENPGDAPMLLDLSSGRRITLQNAVPVIGPRFVRKTPFLMIEDWMTPPRDLLAWDTHSGACAYRLPAPPLGPGIGSITYALADEHTVARLFSTATAGTYRLDVFELPDPRTP